MENTGAWGPEARDEHQGLGALRGTEIDRRAALGVGAASLAFLVPAPARAADSPSPARTRPREVASAAASTGQAGHLATSRGGARIAWDDAGKGDVAFVCLPGWCIHRSLFAPLMPLLARNDRVLALDWRAHGGSGAAPGDFDSAALLDDALSVIQASGARQIIPVAQAHAGWVAIELAKRLEGRVKGLVFLSWLVLEPPPPFKAALAELQDPARWEAGREKLLSMWLAGAPPAVASQVRKEMLSHGAAMWARAAREIGRSFEAAGSPLRALAGLASPPRTLHLYAQPRVPEFLAAQEQFSREHAWFSVKRLDGATHFPSLETPADCAAAITAWRAKSTG